MPIGQRHDLAQHGVADRAVGEPVDGSNHRHLRRIPGDSAPVAGGQLGESLLQRLHELGSKSELDRSGADQRPVGELAGDEQRLVSAIRASADSGHHEPLVSAELVLDPRGASPARRVARVEALGDDALQTEVGDVRDERLRLVADDARRGAPGRSVKRELVEQGPALAVGQSPGRAAVEMEDVEDLEQRRRGIGAGAGQTAA